MLGGVKIIEIMCWYVVEMFGFKCQVYFGLFGFEFFFMKGGDVWCECVIGFFFQGRVGDLCDVCEQVRLVFGLVWVVYFGVFGVDLQ